MMLSVVSSMGLDKCIKTCIHHYGIESVYHTESIESLFTALKILLSVESSPIVS